jgi:hypothetical protein
LARALHPDFGLFWPSPGFLRKLSIAVAFIAIGLIAGANGILLLLSDEEPDASSAFALARPEPRMPTAAPESRMPGIAARETGVRALPSPPPAATVVQPPRAEPKVIRVERKPMQGFEPSRAEAKPIEAKPTPGERATALPALPDQGVTPPSGGIATMPLQASTPPQTAAEPVTPPSVAPPPRTPRRTSHGVSRNHAEHSRGYSYHQPRPSGGFAVLW